jgi:HlyD family secretion protein
MANSKKRRKIVVFSVIGLVLLALTGAAMFRKRDVVVTVQTEKVARRNITEVVVANGKIQPVVQVKISPEVSGEIISLPVKEGQAVKKGDLLVKIKPDFYIAQSNQCQAGYQSSVAAKAAAEATMRKEEAEFKRNEDLFRHKLISDSAFDEARASRDLAVAQFESAGDQVEVARAGVDSARDSLEKTTIVSPLSGTVSKLNSELGERVLGTVQNVGTEIMTIADLNEMEARVDIGETDVVLIKPGEKVRLEVDAFKDRKFTGAVTEIANSAKSVGYGGNTQDATKFEVRIRIKEKEQFRPGMSVTAEIETRYGTNVLAVPIACVTTRLPKEEGKKAPTKVAALKDPPATNSAAARTNSTGAKTNSAAANTNSASGGGTNTPSGDKKKEAVKPVEVVFVVEGDHAKMVPVKHGISDDTHWEITDGLKEGEEVVSGGYRAISKDLEDGKKIVKGSATGGKEKEGEKQKAD